MLTLLLTHVRACVCEREREREGYSCGGGVVGGGEYVCERGGGDGVGVRERHVCVCVRMHMRMFLHNVFSV